MDTHIARFLAVRYTRVPLGSDLCLKKNLVSPNELMDIHVDDVDLRHLLVPILVDVVKNQAKITLRTGR
jgi:hypothetical protein